MQILLFQIRYQIGDRKQKVWLELELHIWDLLLNFSQWFNFGILNYLFYQGKDNYR